MRASRSTLAAVALLAFLASPTAVAPQPPRLPRVGIVHLGGPYAAAVDGLRDGLKPLGLEDGKDVVLRVRDTGGDLKAVESAARAFEADHVDLIYSLATSVTLAARRATNTVPIVFYAGGDPVAFGLVESFRRPGGRLTGIYGRFTDLTPKRLELLKEMMPRLRRVVTFYNPDNPAASPSVKLAREAARQLKVELVERPVRSVAELHDGLHALRPGEADAFFYVADAMMTSQSASIIAAMRAKRLPTIFADEASAAQGALASYGVSYRALGRLSARHVQRVLLGAKPGDLPVEQVDKLQFVINLKTAKALGLAIPPAVLLRADEIIE